jgi:hypothetical protein
LPSFDCQFQRELECHFDTVIILYGYTQCVQILEEHPGLLKIAPKTRDSPSCVTAIRFGLVAAHVGLLRLVVATVRMASLVLPMVMAERVVVPRMAQAVGVPWLYPVCVLLVAMSCALVTGIFAAFVAVYDARLFVALQSAEIWNIHHSAKQRAGDGCCARQTQRKARL